MNNQSEEGLRNAYSLLEEGKPSEAKAILADILEFNLDNSEIDFAVWCCSYWIDYIKRLPKYDSYEQGEELFFQWKSFEAALDKKKEIYDRSVFSVQTGIFNLALKSFTQAAESDAHKGTVQKADILLKTGICNKKLGKYDLARSCLTEANRLTPGSAQIIAEMADCFALCGAEADAKLLFREAFFIDAKKIDLHLLDSELIKCLITRVKESKYSEQELQYWVPVYAVLYGIFTIKRELRSVEVLKLKQSIFECEMEIKNPANNIKLLKPKLIYMYFRLIDHYVHKNEPGNEINDILLKIKILDKNVYELYVK